jgi:hypothetical protein
MPRKPTRSSRPPDQKRIDALEKRLDLAMAEHRRLRDELDALRARDPLHELRNVLQRQLGRRYPGATRESLCPDIDPDDTIN